MKTNRYEVALLVGVCVLAVFGFACTPTPPTDACVAGASTRTQGCDEFKGLNARLYKNEAEHTAGDWHPLDTGDTLHTDSSGEAELNFSDCWSGRLYLFENSAGEIFVRDCRKASYDSVSNLCIPNGTWYSGKCRGEFSATTGSVRLTKLGTSFSITALPEDRETSLVVVLEGQILVEPVLSYEPTKLGQAVEVAEEQFYFTMPDAMLTDVAGLEPRAQHPVEKLGPVARELGIVDWMFDVRDRAGKEDVLPPNWPPELGGEARPPTEPPPTEPPTEPPPTGNGFVVTSGGGALNDPRVQEAMLRGVDWQTAGPAGTPDGGKVVAFVGNQPVDPVSDLAYDPEKSKALLEEADYRPDQPLVVLHPAGDQPLEKVAHLVARDLGMLGIKAVVQAVPAAELSNQASARMQAGEPVIAVSR
jgi:hypothetical protein